MDKRPPSKLLNSLIEMYVVIGMDQDTDLIPSSEQAKKSKTVNSSVDSSVLFSTNFTPLVLAALSGQTASFPQADYIINGEPFYPSGSVVGKTPVKKMGMKARRSSVVPNAGTVLPISSEVINSLSPLCLPDGGYVYSTSQEDSVHFLVLTDIEGNRTYCCCLTIYRPFGAKESEDIPGTYELIYMGESNDAQAMKGSEYSLCYVPLCCCCISKYPYFSVLKDSLSSLLGDLRQEPHQFRMALMQFVSQLAMVPVPPAGSLGIEFSFSGVTYVVRPADDPEARIVDIELHYPFLCFSVDDVLLLMSCILTQQRLVFVSSRYSLLTLIVESIFTFIQPFTWSWTYVPVLPSNLIDLVEAPGSYIMGSHVRNKEQIEKVMKTAEMADMIIADIDEGSITMGDNVTIHRIPNYIAEFFKFRMKKAPVCFDLLLSSRPSFSSLADAKKERDSFSRDFQQLVLAATLEMMVRIFSDLTVYTVQEEFYFDMDAFIDSKPLEDQPFYKVVCATHAFSSFLDNRLRFPEKRDYFAAMTEKNRPHPNRQGLRKRSSTVNAVTPTQVPIFTHTTNTDAMTTFLLPPFMLEGIHTGSFYDQCLSDLKTNIEGLDSKSSNLLASYLYLRGMFNVARGHRIAALDDFYAVSTRNVQLFPNKIVCDIVSNLTSSEEKELQTKSFFRKAIALKHPKEYQERHRRDRRQVITSAVPSSPLGKAEFLKRISMLQNTSAESGEKLFEALTLNKTNGVVDPDEFACFYKALSEADREAQAIPLSGITPEEGEEVVMATQLIKTDRAMGRLILTASRLLFLAEGSFKCETVMRIEHIQDIEYYQHYVVLPPGAPALKITCRNKSVPQFIVCLKEDRSFWYECLREMQAGVRISEESKDLQGIKQASQNVMVADALRRSGHTDLGTGHVLYLSKTHKTQTLSKETKKVLVMRINPTTQALETEKTTVEAMIYAPSTDSCDEEVWCGLGSGAVVVIDARSWKCIDQLWHAKDRVSCLIPVGDHHIWVGSMDTTIYIINRRTRQADHQLHGHPDFLSHMISTKENDGTTTVWSASLNGLIIGWDPDTLTSKKSLKLENVNTLTSLIALGDYFWCVTKVAVLVVDRHSDGTSYRTLTLAADHDIPRSFDCMCAVSPTEVWTGCDKKGVIAIWDANTYQYKTSKIRCKGFTQMVYVDGKVWAGDRGGTLYVLNAKSCRLERVLELHEDRIRSMCLTDTSYVLTGPGSRDGRIAVWRSQLLEDVVDAPGFEIVDSDIVRQGGKKNKKK